MESEVPASPKILIVSEKIPPDYTGAGTSAMLIASHFHKKGMLFKVLTRTKIKYNRDELITLRKNQPCYTILYLTEGSRKK